MKDTFDAVPISVATHLKSEPETTQCCLEMSGIIDEDRGLIEVVFPLKLTEKSHGELARAGMKQPDVNLVIQIRIDGSIQPVALIVQLDHGLVEGNVIWGRPASRLAAGFLHPSMDGCAVPVDTQSIEYRDCIRK